MSALPSPSKSATAFQRPGMPERIVGPPKVKFGAAW
jgi:hypothetical protein